MFDAAKHAVVTDASQGTIAELRARLVREEIEGLLDRGEFSLTSVVNEPEPYRHFALEHVIMGGRSAPVTIHAERDVVRYEADRTPSGGSISKRIVVAKAGNNVVDATCGVWLLWNHGSEIHSNTIDPNAAVCREVGPGEAGRASRKSASREAAASPA